MAYHYIDKGATELIVGAVYWSGKSWDRHRYGLKLINDATGIARLECLTGAWAFDVFVSAAELTTWTMIRKQ